MKKRQLKNMHPGYTKVSENSEFVSSVSGSLMQKVLTIQSLFMRAITLLVFSFFFALLVIYGQIVEILVHTHKATKNGKTKLIKYD